MAEAKSDKGAKPGKPTKVPQKGAKPPPSAKGAQAEAGKQPRSRQACGGQGALRAARRVPRTMSRA